MPGKPANDRQVNFNPEPVPQVDPRAAEEAEVAVEVLFSQAGVYILRLLLSLIRTYI